MAIAGRVAIVPKGDWSADVTYKRLDAVTYNNTLYFAKKDVPAGTATSNTEYWSKSIVGGVGTIAKPEEAGIVKPDGKSMSVDESGTLSINLDGTTITLDEAKNVIKLADALKDKIGSALQPESIVNNQVTTENGFALDARQANPNIDGSLAKQISDLNGRLKRSDLMTLNSYQSKESFCAAVGSLHNSEHDIYVNADIVARNIGNYTNGQTISVSNGGSAFQGTIYKYSNDFFGIYFFGYAALPIWFRHSFGYYFVHLFRKNTDIF